MNKYTRAAQDEYLRPNGGEDQKVLCNKYYLMVFCVWIVIIVGLGPEAYKEVMEWWS